MVIKVFGPIEKPAEKEIRIELKEPISTQKGGDGIQEAEGHGGLWDEGLTNRLPPMGQLLSEYYAHRGWTEDGIPTPGKPKGLGLDELQGMKSDGRVR